MRLFNWEFFSVFVKTSKKIRISVVNTYYGKKRRKKDALKKEGKKKERTDACEACNVTYKKTKKVLDSRLLFDSSNMIECYCLLSLFKLIFIVFEIIQILSFRFWYKQYSNY